MAEEKRCVVCRMCWQPVIASCRARGSHNELSKVLNPLCCSHRQLRHNFLSTLATFQCHRKTKRWSEARWLAAFRDRDKGFVPLLLLCRCSASSHSRDVTAKSVKTQQRPPLFFNTVEVKLVKPCDLENKYATPKIPMLPVFFSAQKM